MMKELTAYIFWVLLVTTGLVALARWFHPATFSLQALLYVTIAAFIVGVVYLARYSR